MILPFISQLHPDDLRHLQGRVSPTTWRLFDACTVASLCLKLCVWSSSYAPRQPPLHIYIYIIIYIYTCCFKLLLNRCHKVAGLTAVAQWLYSHQYLREHFSSHSYRRAPSKQSNSPQFITWAICIYIYTRHHILHHNSSDHDLIITYHYPKSKLRKASEWSYPQPKKSHGPRHGPHSQQ